LVRQVEGGDREATLRIVSDALRCAEGKQPVTPGMALWLGKLCGNGPDLWLNLQKRYDLRQSERELGEKIKSLPTLEVA